ncbi:MAG: LamG-like jellyroll fold domain-containing protein [bacterium]
MAGPVPAVRSLAVRRSGQALLLLAVLAGAALLRLPGVVHGIPYVYEWDEPTVMNAVIGMLQRGDWTPRTYVYPPVYFYMLYPVMALHYRVLHAAGLLASPATIALTPPDGTQYYWYLGVPTFYVWGRLLTVLFGVACVYLTYHIGRRAFGALTGFVAAAVLAVAPGAVYYAGVLRTDVPMTFMVLLTFAAGLRILRGGTRLDYLLAGLLAGLAIVTKYPAFPVVISLVTAHLLAPGRRRLVDTNIAVLGGGILAGIVIGFPELAVRTQAVLQEIHAVRLARMGPPFATLVLYLRYLTTGITWIWFIPRHAGLGLIAVVLAAAGALIAWREHWRAQLLVLSFAVPSLAITSTQGYMSPQYMAPLLPFAALLAARAIAAAADWLARNTGTRRAAPAVAAALIAAVLAGPAAESARLERGFLRPDSRVTATAWLRTHVPAGSTVAVAEDLHWFLPSFEGAPFKVLVATRAQETSSWLLQQHVDYYAEPSARDAFPRFPRLAAFAGDPRMAAPPDSPVNLVPIIDPAIMILDARGALPADTDTTFPRRVAPDEMIAEPARSPVPGTITDVVHLPGLHVKPGRYAVSITAGRVSPGWLPPLVNARYRIRVLAGDREVGAFTVDDPTPRTYTTPPFDVTAARTLPLRLIEELRGSVWTFRPARDRCARVPDAAGLNPQQFTVEAWVWINDLHHTSPANEEHEARILAKNAESGYTLRIEGQRLPETWKLELALAGQWSLVTGSAGVGSTGPEGIIPLRTWTHVAATADGRVARIYINGAPVGTQFTANPSGAYTGPIKSAGAPLLIGCRAIFDDWFDGAIAQVRIWDHALSPEELKRRMAVAPKPDDAGLLGAWSFETVTPDGRIPDLSGHRQDIPDAAGLTRVLEPLVLNPRQAERSSSSLPVPGQVMVQTAP